MKNIRLFGLAALVLALVGCGSATDEQGIKDVYDTTPAIVRQIDNKRKSVAFILDTSNSMDYRLNGERKIDIAKKSLDEILKIYKQYNDATGNIEAGLFYFSSEGMMSVVKNLVPIGKFDYNKLTEKFDKLTPQTGTPLGVALAYSERELDTKATGTKNIVLLTDGENSVGKEPYDIWKQILETNTKTGDSPTNLYVVAFNIKENLKKYFDGLKELDVIVYEAKDASELSQVLKDNTGRILEKY